MTCPNCGANNINGSSFCIKCGAHLKEIQQPVNQAPNESVQPMNREQIYNNQTINNNMGMVDNNQPINNVQPMNNNQNINYNQTINTNQNINTGNSNMVFMEYFSIVFAILLKPFTAFKSKINRLDDFKNSAIITAIVAVIATLLNLITTIINTVRVTTGGFLTETKTKWVWENLKEIKYVKVIGMNLIIFFGIVFSIACVYYLASLIIKKQIHFSKILGVAAISVVPALLGFLLLSPILSMISSPIGIGVTIVGCVYTLLLLYETINTEILSLEGNVKYYFNLLCLSILMIAGYYLIMKMFMGEISSDVSDILDMFK